MPFLAKGWSDAKVAKKIDRTRQSVHAFRTKPETQKALDEIRRHRNKRIAEIGARACMASVRELKRGLKSPDESHRRGCANDLLGKFGFGPGSRVELSGEVKQPVKLDLSGLSIAELRALRKGRGDDVVATDDPEAPTE